MLLVNEVSTFEQFEDAVNALLKNRSKLCVTFNIIYTERCAYNVKG